MKKKSKKKEDNSKPWTISTNRYVGFVDIMGFKDMLARMIHEKVYELMKNVSNTVSSVQSVFTVDNESENDEDDSVEVNVTMMLYSDSSMSYTRDDEAHSLENLITSISELSLSLFNDGIPHKGAIAFGQMTLDFERSIFFGQPLVDAYLLQDELKYYGIVVHGTAEINGDIINNESIFEYNCPFKTGVAKHLTIAPGVELSEEFDIDTLTALKENVENLRIRTSGALRKYIDNTIDYLDLVKKEGERILKEADLEDEVGEAENGSS
jgi:hypothetical protein